jgi:CBS domain containing-hemolysin-like protein
MPPTVITLADIWPYSLAELPLLLLLPLLLIGSGFFSGSETALFGLSANNRQRIIRRGGVIGHIVEQLFVDTQMLLITLMFGNMTVNVLYFVISSALLLKVDATQSPTVFALAAILPVIGIIIFGEVVPKLIANTLPGVWVRVTSIPLFAIHRAIGGLRVVLGAVVIKPLGRLLAPPNRPPALSAGELEALVSVSQQRGVIDPGEEQLLREVVNLSRLKVRDVMVPRVNMIAVDINTPPAELLSHIRTERVTKMPVYDGDIDHIEGVIYARQFLLARPPGVPVEQVDLKRLIRKVRFVPELQRVDELLADFRKTGTHLAIAVDEFGGTAGLVTLKDVVERMVGELDFDEHPAEEPPPEAQPLGDGVWRVSGRLMVHDWAQTFGAERIPPRVATVGGLVTALLGRIPRVGEVATLGNLMLRVERMDGGRVASVILSISDQPVERHSEGGGP